MNIQDNNHQQKINGMNYVGNEENVCRDLQQYQNILDTFYQL